MATAVLENINPYSKLGLKRRPTYEEVIGLISENETLTGALPDRTATRFKASPEGSFFDGLDHLEILKEQQNRIHERQMRELLMRQNIGGGTFSIERLRQQMRERDQLPQAEVQEDDFMDASIQAELQERARQAVERQQQTGEEHRRGGFLSRNASSIIEGIIGGLTPSSRDRRMPTTNVSTPSEVYRIFDDPENFDIGTPESSDPEMLTARTDASDTDFKINYSTNISNMSVKALKIQLFLRGVDVDAPEYSLENLRKKGKGKGLTEKQHYSNLANQLIQSGQWETLLSANEIRRKLNTYKNKNRARGSQD